MTPAQLRKMVATMRELDVLECDGIRLAPKQPPPPKRDPDAPEPPKPETLAERQHRIMFAHTSYRPPLPTPTTPPSDVPRAVAQRRETTVSDDGDGEEARPTRASKRAR